MAAQTRMTSKDWVNIALTTIVVLAIAGAIVSPNWPKSDQRYGGLRVGAMFTLPPSSFFGCRDKAVSDKIWSESGRLGPDEAQRLLKQAISRRQCSLVRDGEEVLVTETTFSAFRVRRKNDPNGDHELWIEKSFPK